jgi:hypothetical protein
MWWETGKTTPELRNFLRRILRLSEEMLAGVVYRGHQPRSLNEAKARVRRYAKRTGPPDILPVVDAFGVHGAGTEFAILKGALGLSEAKEPLGATIQKLAPLWAELSALPPPGSIDSAMKIIGPHLSSFALVAQALAPHYSLSEVNTAIDEATDEDLFGARTYLRAAAAGVLRLGGTRSYYRRLRKVLTAVSKVFRGRASHGHRAPRWTKRFQDVYTWEGLLAFATFVLLRIRQAMREIDTGRSEPAFQTGRTRAEMKNETN